MPITEKGYLSLGGVLGRFERGLNFRTVGITGLVTDRQLEADPSRLWMTIQNTKAGTTLRVTINSSGGGVICELTYGMSLQFDDSLPYTGSIRLADGGGNPDVAIMEALVQR